MSLHELFCRDISACFRTNMFDHLVLLAFFVLLVLNMVVGGDVMLDIRCIVDLLVLLNAWLLLNPVIVFFNLVLITVVVLGFFLNFGALLRRLATGLTKLRA